jgi:U4/U6.U5 tri-snRNP-associated protein 1
VKQDDPKNAESKVVSVSVPVSDSEDAHVVSKMPVEVVSIEETEKDENENHQTLEELADQVEEDSGNAGAFESTESAVGVGRGMSAFLGMLKQTGEVAGKSAGKEELRGRAKDEKTYDDYAPLDLKKVVKIDTTDLRGRPHEKDVELANREVKLEYRDDHGRLLTRKEAYRQLCYQFHGHGSSKRNEEKRLQQIEREQAERSANNGISGTLGALKATQKATGKAFVLHKT